MLKNKYSLANCNKLDNMNNFELSNCNGLDESILNAIGLNIPNFEYSSADGEDEAEYEDEESVEYEESDASEAGGVDEADLPKFRQLVRAKKLEYKAKYGKAHFGKQKKCQNVKVPCPTWKNPLKMCDKKVCVDVPKFITGWRKQWRKFKQQGGLAQLKQQSKGAAPIPAPVNTTTPSTTGGVAPSGISKLKPKLIKKINMEKVSVRDSKGATSKEESIETKATESVSDKSMVDDDGKILGMSKPLAIGLGIVLVVGGFLAYKKFSK